MGVRSQPSAAEGAVVRLLLISIILLILPAVVQAQNRVSGESPYPQAANLPFAPEQKPAVFRNKIFWPLVGAYAASAIADAQTSYKNEQKFPKGTEQNDWLYGRRPSLARYYLTNAAIDGAATFISYKVLHSRRKSLRVAGWGLLAEGTASHASAAIANSRQ